MQYKDKFDWSVYAIVDQNFIRDRSIEIVTEQMIAGGADVIQYRNKTQTSRVFYDNAYLIHKIAATYEIPFIVNDRIDIALALNADGVHLGQTDLPFDVARELVGEKMIIGASISNLSEFENTSDADYFGVGALFPTETKQDAEISGLDLVKLIRRLTDLPLVGIGGIHAENVASVIQAGCDGVAVISAILNTKDIQSSVFKLKNIVINSKSGFIK